MSSGSIPVLQTGRIWLSDKKDGFVKGPLRAACFMDVPFDPLRYILHEENSSPNGPRFEAFCVFVTKKHAYQEECRPVLYLSNEEGLPQLSTHSLPIGLQGHHKTTNLSCWPEPLALDG